MAHFWQTSMAKYAEGMHEVSFRDAIQGNHARVTRKSRESHKEVMRTRHVQDVSFCES